MICLYSRKRKKYALIKQWYKQQHENSKIANRESFIVINN